MKKLFLLFLMLSTMAPSMHADKTSTLKGAAKIVGGLALIAASGVATFKYDAAIIENRAIANGKYQRMFPWQTVASNAEHRPHWAYAFLPLAIIPGFILGGSLVKQGWDDIAKYQFFKLNEQQLVEQIKADIYKVFIQEMWIVSKDFAAMAQGNAALEQDLKDLYDGSFGSRETAQKKVDIFCKKWKLEKINI